MPAGGAARCAAAVRTWQAPRHAPGCSSCVTTRPPRCLQTPGSASSKGAGPGTFVTCSPGSGDAADGAEYLGKKQGDLPAYEAQPVVAWSAPASLPSSGFSTHRSGSMGGAAASKLPPGLDASLPLPLRAVPGPPRAPRLGCPPPPHPSVASSMATRSRPRGVHTVVATSPGLAGSPGVGVSPPSGSGPSPSPQAGGLLTPRAAAAAAARQRSHGAGAGADPLAPLLCQMPTYGWQRSIVDYAAIRFLLAPDGSYVELGSGASATVRTHPCTQHPTGVAAA